MLNGETARRATPICTATTTCETPRPASSGVTVIRNGRVIDVHNGIDTLADVYIQHGRIYKVVVKHGEDSTSTTNPDADVDIEFESCIDASGCIVTPGLVDCHVHAYQYATPLGIDVDRTCLARGVTTAVDAGSSGSSTFEGFNKLIRERCRTRLYAFLHIAKHGLATAGCSGLKPGGECDSLNAVDPDSCCDVIKQNPDVIVGVKVRLAASVADQGRNEQEILRRSLEAAERANVPLMVHHALSTVTHLGTGDLLGCPGSLRCGDILTHCFHGHQANILDPGTGRVSEACWDAKRRGVVFDLGHGQGSFSWSVAEQSVREGLWPDTISTDLHKESVQGPAYSLLCSMTKMIRLGMPLRDVIAAVTCRPAAVIGKLDEIGHLSPGMPADVSIVRLVELEPRMELELEDSLGETRSIRESLELVGALRGGIQQPVLTLRPWPNPSALRGCLARRNQYKVKV